ncbi:MAG: HAD family phosphatase [Clostridia bacterium]|nr:HAD family phosphatase [Clostridia bacterium]
MAQIRLVGIDLDGTFLAPNGKPSAASLKAVSDCKKAGIPVCICTGRSLGQIQDILAFNAEVDELCVVTNGASIINWRTEEYVLHRRLDPELVEPMLRALMADCQSVPGRHFFVSGMFKTHVLRACANPNQLSAWETMPGRVIHETIEEMIEASALDIQRIDYSVPFTDGPRVQELLMPIVPLDITTGDPRRLELVPKGINKGEGLMHLAEHFGVPQESVMAIGDGWNDDSMIRWAGLGVAMGNAVPSLKALADVICQTNEEDGFAKAIEEYVLCRK